VSHAAGPLTAVPPSLFACPQVIEYERQKLAFFKKNVTPVMVSPKRGRTGGRGETQD